MPDVEERSDKHAELDYRNLMVSQENKVRQITDELGQKPSDDLRVNLVRETELLNHFVNATKGNPKHRAAVAAQIAKQSVLNKAVV